MLSRISLVEQELQSERKRGDALEEDVFKWRRQASELEWELKASRAERHDMTSRIDELASENVILKKQNASLASELRELNSQIRAGHPPLTLPPRLPPRLPPKAK
jgi:chromosome segregation ATPase